MSINARLSDLLDYLLEVQLAVPEQVPDAERARTGTADNWSIKDTLAHNAEWAAHHLAELETLERGEPWPAQDHGDFEAENQAIFELYEKISWDDLLAMLRDTYGRGQAYLGRMPEADLLAPLPAEPERPVWSHLASDYVNHPVAHVWVYLFKNGHRDLIDGWFGESFHERLLAVSDDGRWQGATLYNQACFLALSGKSERALERLAEALALAPHMKAWAAEDPDLASLRDEPAFQALYE